MQPVVRRDGNEDQTTDWSFYGGSVEQGLMYYYYFCTNETGPSLLLDMVNIYQAS